MKFELENNGISLWTKNKCFSIRNNKKWWSKNGIGRMWKITDNGGRKRNGDKCFDFHVYLGYIVLNYTNFNLQDK